MTAVDRPTDTYIEDFWLGKWLFELLFSSAKFCFFPWDLSKVARFKPASNLDLVGGSYHAVLLENAWSFWQTYNSLNYCTDCFKLLSKQGTWVASSHWKLLFLVGQPPPHFSVFEGLLPYAYVKAKILQLEPMLRQMWLEDLEFPRGCWETVSTVESQKFGVGCYNEDEAEKMAFWSW